MLFRKNMEKMCAYCKHSTPNDEDTVLCSKKGIKSWDDKCLSFSYDPCKRAPKKPKAVDFARYEEYDYSL